MILTNKISQKSPSRKTLPVKSLQTLSPKRCDFGLVLDLRENAS